MNAKVFSCDLEFNIYIRCTQGFYLQHQNNADYHHLTLQNSNCGLWWLDNKYFPSRDKNIAIVDFTLLQQARFPNHLALHKPLKNTKPEVSRASILKTVPHWSTERRKMLCLLLPIHPVPRRGKPSSASCRIKLQWIERKCGKDFYFLTSTILTLVPRNEVNTLQVSPPTTPQCGQESSYPHWERSKFWVKEDFFLFFPR